MKLHRLRLENFRQFLGEQEIVFSLDKSLNVTVVWGANGSGKTTLLNAFTWVLYKEFTDDVEKTYQLYNLDGWSKLASGERMTVSVELEFEDEGKVFTVLRQSRFAKTPDGAAVCEQDGELVVTFRDETGRSQKPGNPSETIKQILPERLRRFFFFNGERIGVLARADAYEEIEDAIKTVLGLSVVERAIKHLPTTIKKFENELKMHGTDEQREAASELNDLDTAIEQHQQALAESRRAETQWQVELAELDQKLRGSEQSRELQRRRDELAADEIKRAGEIDQLGKKIDLLVRERGFLAAGAGLFASIRDLFVEKRERKELPAPVKIDFIEDLLDDGTCICGASLAEGTSGHEHIAEWKQRAGLAEVEERWISLHSYAGHMEKSRAELGDQLNELLTGRLAAVQARDFIREQLSEVSTQLQSHSIDEIAKLEDARVKVGNHLNDELRRQGRLETELARLGEAKRRASVRLDKAQSVEAKAALAQRRVAATREALDILEKIFDVRTQLTRAALDQEIKRVHNSISYKPDIPSVNERFELQLRRGGNDEPAAKSSGENQILSLSFVGALASRARSRFEEKSSGGAESERGGIYPIVMDSLFGPLEENYQSEVAIALPQLTEQIVLLVSKSQGQAKAVYEHIAPRIGRSYVISYVTPKPDAKVQMITLGDETYPLIVPSPDGSEYAKLTEVS